MLTIDDFRAMRKNEDDIYLGEPSAKMKKETKESWKLIFEMLEEFSPDMKVIKRKEHLITYKVEITHGKLGSLPVLITFDTVCGVLLQCPLVDVGKLTTNQLYELMQGTLSGFTLADGGLSLTVYVPIHCMMPYTFYELLLNFANEQANTVLKIAEYLGIQPGDSEEDEDDDSEEEEDDDEEQPEVSMADIFRLTPKTNCKDCDCPSCMIFAREVLHGNITINQCPYIE